MKIPARYNTFPGNPGLVYASICKTLSNRSAPWSQFGSQEWLLLPQIAQTEGVGPLLYWHFINENWQPDIPKGVADALMGQYYSTMGQNTLLFRELDRILTALAEAEIPVILLKGAALAQTIYPDPGLRPMGDLDLLVTMEQVSQALHVLLNMQYEPLFVTSHHVGMTKPSNPDCLIELHFEIPIEKRNRTLISADWFWSQKTVFLFGTNSQQNLNYFQLNPTAELIYLVGHLKVQHSSDRRLIWLYDLYRLISTHKDDVVWENLGLIAGKAQLSSELDATFRELDIFFGLIIQPDIIASINQNSKASKEIIDYRKQSLSSSTWKVMRSFSIKTRFRLITQFLFLDKARIIHQYKPQPEWLWPLYYPYRWFDFAVDLTRTLAGKMKMRQVDN